MFLHSLSQFKDTDQCHHQAHKPSTLTDKVMLVPCFTFLLLNLSRKRGGTRGSLESVKKRRK